MRHLLAQIAADGSQKIPIRVLPTLQFAAAEGRPARGAALVVAAWVLHLRGSGVPVTDVSASPLVAAEGASRSTSPSARTWTSSGPAGNRIRRPRRAKSSSAQTSRQRPPGGDAGGAHRSRSSAEARQSAAIWSHRRRWLESARIRLCPTPPADLASPPGCDEGCSGRQRHPGGSILTHGEPIGGRWGPRPRRSLGDAG